MGTVTLSGTQALIQRVSDILQNGEEVPVRIITEPDNPIDKMLLHFSALWIIYGTSSDMRRGKLLTSFKKQLQTISFKIHNLRQFAMFALGHDVLQDFMWQCT